MEETGIKSEESGNKSLGSSQDVDVDANPSIMKIPNEIWVIILAQLNQKELVQARTVWKRWRQVVDAHFEFTVIIYEGKTNLDRVYELRIRDCLITRLTSDKDIFQYPNLLRRVRFWGPVSVAFFQRVMDTAVCIEELSLTKFALMQPGLVDERNLNGFSNIKKLELLGYMCKDESNVIRENVSRILSYTMPELEKLTINFHCSIPAIQAIAIDMMRFISRHHRLKNLNFSLVPESVQPNEPEAGRVTSVIIPNAVEELMKFVKLNVLRITTSTKDLSIWNALLNTQNSLQDFRMLLSEGGLLASHTEYTIGIPSEHIREPLLRNVNTLTSVELKEIRLSTANDQRNNPIPFDAGVFRFAENLKRLILYRNYEDYRRFSQSPNHPNIINFNRLPTTIQVLEVSRFSCRSEEIQFVCDILEDLKNIVLLHTGHINQLGIHGGIIESICNKSGINSMNLTPINHYCSIENKKLEEVNARFRMDNVDHLFYDFEKFRKGLPQPCSRPSSKASSSMMAEPSGPFRLSILSKSTRKRKKLLTGYERYRRRDYIRHNEPAFLDLAFQPIQRLRLLKKRKEAGCCQNLLIEDHLPGQCPGAKVSRVFHSLDLQLSPGLNTVFNSNPIFESDCDQLEKRKRRCSDSDLPKIS